MNKESQPVNNKPMSKLMFIIALFMSAIVLLPTYIVLIVGMIPTISVIFTKKPGSSNHKIYCVGGLNLTGLIPTLFDMYSISNTTEYAFSAISNVNNLMIIYGISLIGYGIYVFLPKTLIMFYKISASSRIIAIKKKQAKIINVWGNEVTKM